ncbi:MAG TPA: putative LPS assembly protein LptD, partial [Methylotenera sp.]|nr:putative LPS assembly protein LptD [Methylotenera sp.]
MLNSRVLSGFTALILACSLPVQAADENIETETLPPSETSTEAPLSTPVDNASEGITDGIIIDGDKLELHLDRKMRAIGNASITRDKQTIQGDVIDYDVQNDELRVTGNASINVGNATLTGPELTMRLSESIGEMHDASISLKNPVTPASTDNVAQPIASSETFSKRLGNLQNQQIGGESLLSSGQFSSLNTESEESLIQDNAAQTSASKAPQPQSRGDAKAIFFEGQDKKRLIDARYTTCEVGVDDWYIKAKEIELNDFTESGVARNAYMEFKGVPFIYTPWVSFSYNNQRKSGLLAPTVGSTSRSGFEVSTPFYWNISPNMDATFATRVLSKRGIQLQGEFRYLEENFSGIDSLEYLQKDNL